MSGLHERIVHAKRRHPPRPLPGGGPRAFFRWEGTISRGQFDSVPSPLPCLFCMPVTRYQVRNALIGGPCRLVGDTKRIVSLRAFLSLPFCFVFGQSFCTHFVSRPSLVALASSPLVLWSWGIGEYSRVLVLFGVLADHVHASVHLTSHACERAFKRTCKRALTPQIIQGHLYRDSSAERLPGFHGYAQEVCSSLACMHFYFNCANARHQ